MLHNWVNNNKNDNKKAHWSAEVKPFPVLLAVSVETQAELFTLYLGDRLDLTCSAKDSLHAVNWTKDHVAVVDGEHTRIRNGQLEIETVELSDSGLYTCTTFGNHSLYFNVTGKSHGGGADEL